MITYTEVLIISRCLSLNIIIIHDENKYTLIIKNVIKFFSLEPQIKKSVKELGELLQSIKGGSQNPQQVSMMEVDEILRPLMDLMDGSLSLFAQTCEKPVLKRILRELWKLVIRILERSVVLPPMMDKSVRNIIWNK